MNSNITLLVIDSDKNYAKTLAEYAKNHPLFLDASYASDGAQGLEMAKLIKPDVIIMDFLISEIDAIGFMRILNRTPDLKKPFIIINSHTMTAVMLKTASQLGADYFMIKPQRPVEICNTVSDLISSKEEVPSLRQPTESDILDQKITQFMHCMGIPAHLDGYSYIRSSLKLAIEDIGEVNPITRKLYPKLAREYNKTPGSIERSIRHAIKVSWSRGNKKIIHDVFGYSADTSSQSCPTNSEYIAMAADDLKMRLKHDIPV